MRMYRILRFASMTLVSALFAFEGAYAQSDTFIERKLPSEILKGEARFKDGSFAYSETHTLTAKDGRLDSLVTEYRGVDGVEIAKMRHTFIAPGFLPDYEYEDLRNKVVHRLTVDRAAKKISLYRKVGGKEDSETIPLEGNMATGQGVYFWVIANLPELLKGGKVGVRFVVPAILDKFPFRAQLVKPKTPDAAKHTIKIELQNWLLNLFLSRLEFDVDSKTNRLLEYRGTSNVADDKGEYRDVVIKY